MTITWQGAILLLIGMNVLSFALFGIDKYKAKHKMWRIPEKTLLLCAALGAGLGALIGMRYFRHKTKVLAFKVLVPVILTVQILLLLFAIFLTLPPDVIMGL